MSKQDSASNNPESVATLALNASIKALMLTPFCPCPHDSNVNIIKRMLSLLLHHLPKWLLYYYLLTHLL